MSTMQDWVDEVKSELGIDLEVDVTALLGLTKVVAVTVARPAAPLTAFLVGYAAAQAGGGSDAVASASAAVEAMAQRHAATESEPQPDVARDVARPHTQPDG